MSQLKVKKRKHHGGKRYFTGRRLIEVAEILEEPPPVITLDDNESDLSPNAETSCGFIGEINNDDDVIFIDDDDFAPLERPRSQEELAALNVPVEEPDNGSQAKFQYVEFPCSIPECSLILLPTADHAYPNRGFFDLMVLNGSVEIFGYEKTANSLNSNTNSDSNWIRLYSTNVSNPVLYVRNVTQNNKNKNAGRDFRPRLQKFCDQSIIETVLARFQSISCCFVVRKLTNFPESFKFMSLLYNNQSRRIFVPDNRNIKTKNNLVSDAGDKVKYFQYSKQYDSEIDDILFRASQILKSSQNYGLLIAGQSNSGKSVFSRYLMNRCLSRKLPIFYLDCDSGQTEFTLPGCLSLTKIDQPVFGDPFSHLREPVECFFFGEITPSQRTTDYLNVLRALKNRFLELTKGNPALLIINTNGWIQGFGADLFMEVLDLMQPDHVTCMRYPGDSMGDLYQRICHSQSLSKFFEVKCLKSLAADRSGIGPPAKNGPLLRELTIVGYFGELASCQTKNMSTYRPPSLRAAVPYRIDWRQIKIGVLHGKVPPNYLMSVLNGSLVALCCGGKGAENVSPNGETNDDVDTFWMNDPECPMVFNNCLASCIGFGIVRAVDPAAKLLYIITPIEHDKLQNVDVILKGGVNLPLTLIFNANGKFKESLFILKRKRKQSRISNTLENVLTVKSRYSKTARVL